MGTRRDNRLSEGGGSVRIARAKHDLDRRNHELHKQLSGGGTTRPKTPPGPPLMSKSLTLELEKGIGEPRAKARPGRKSYQRQTSNSILKDNTKEAKTSNSILKDNTKEVKTSNSILKDNTKEAKTSNSILKDNTKESRVRRRDMSPSKAAVQANHRRSVGYDNAKVPNVFDRLSKSDADKGRTRPDGNRLRDRSPQKTGRRSPQERDKHSGRKSSDVTRSTQGKRRDPSPVKVVRRNSDNRRSSQRPMTKDVPDTTIDKLRGEDVPESSTKDLEDAPVKDKAVTPPRVRVGDTCEPHHDGRRVNPAPPTRVVATRDKVEGRGRSSPPQKTVDTPAPARTKRPQRSPQDPKVKTTSRESLEERPKQKKTELEGSSIASPAEVIRKVRERVSDGSTSGKTATSDDDKDVCEADGGEDDREFYKIKVQTRLVSYNNSTLVIKNTSKAGDNAHGSDTESESSDDTLQSSSSGPDGAEADVEADTPTDPDLTPTEPPATGWGVAALTRSGSMRGRLSQLVTKGRTFLSDVYSATHTKLAARLSTADHSPDSTRSTSPASNASMDGDDACGFTDNDSGYYSIHDTGGTFGRRHVRASSWCAGSFGSFGSYGSFTPLPSRPPPQPSHARPHPPPSPLHHAVGGTTTAQAYTPCRVVDEVTEALDQTKLETSKEEVNVEAKEEVNVEAKEEANREAKGDGPLYNGVRIDEDWIKKNILCTCKCGDKTPLEDAKTPDTTIVSDNMDIAKCDEVLQSVDTCESVISATESVISTCESVMSENSATESQYGGEEEVYDEEKEEDEEEKAEEDEETEDAMCCCSCHEAEGAVILQLPEDVKELLDTDHARMWWTITGNFGNILPIDWSKTYTRQQYLPVLNLNEAKTPGNEENTPDDDADAEEEEEVAQDLDLHHLILNGLSAEPVKSAEEVIREIDDIMQEGSSSEDEGVEESTSSGETSQDSTTRPLPPHLFADKLKDMSVNELNESVMELELVIREYSETLINQLALRDELEFEKELKNSFISLLLQVQNKRRNLNVEKKKQKKQYLTTVIPYDVGHGPPENQTLQILIKILMAINEDSPTVPCLLTDYILKVLCPS